MYWGQETEARDAYRGLLEAAASVLQHIIVSEAERSEVGKLRQAIFAAIRLDPDAVHWIVVADPATSSNAIYPLVAGCRASYLTPECPVEVFLPNEGGGETFTPYRAKVSVGEKGSATLSEYLDPQHPRRVGNRVVELYQTRQGAEEWASTTLGRVAT